MKSGIEGLNRDRGARGPLRARGVRRAVLAAVAAAAMSAACGSSDGDAILQPNGPGPVNLAVSVNVQLGDTPVGEQPAFIVTTSMSATQDDVAVAAHLDSVVVSYRLNGAPFVVLPARRQTPYASTLPFVAATGDRFTLFARAYASSTGAGGKKATAVGDWDISAVAIPAAASATTP